MKKITQLLFVIVTLTLPCNLLAQATTLDFTGAFVNITGFIPSPATGSITLSDSNSYSVSSVGGGSGIVTRNGSSQLAFTMNDDQSYYSFSRTDGSEFKFETINIEFNISTTTSATLSGLKDGETVVGAFSAITFTQNLAQTIDVSSNQAFNDVDEVRVYFNESVDNNGTTLINSIQYSSAISFNDTRTKISFEPNTWPVASSGQATITGGEFTDGDIKLTLSSGDIYVVDNDGNAGTQALFPSNFVNGETLTIESVAGDEFDFQELIINTFGTSLDANFVSAEGFKNGSSTGIQNTGTGFSVYPSVGQYRVTFDGLIFGDVDRVVITSGNNFGFSLNVIDDIILNYNTGTLSLGQDLSKNAINIYPNPVKNKLQINTNNAAIQEITIYDILGKTILKSQSSIRVLDVSQLKSGMYLIKIKTDYGTSTKRIIKE